ncbi:hypothetical protein N8T08_009324 [Aspergillus melleus]|uniref:Uncharacterized protein n=1 Tax=Aspergillus melleus TaxID=138277 RepID=A0ACC3ATP3_9EURO|nr:hypothetical protein N8T08_009324 [Aspergillus melleus]
MSDEIAGRPRAMSAAASETPVSPIGDRLISPRRKVSAWDEPMPRGRSGSGVLSIGSRASLADGTQPFTLAGPDETPQMRRAHEPFVQPGYAELNPEYEQGVNARPVWSLAKPLPRVVRPGMVPTLDELRQAHRQAPWPAARSHRAGLDVDPDEITKGRVAPTSNPLKIAAQVEDARIQREANLANKILRGETASLSSSSRRLRHASTWALPSDQLATVPEGDTLPDAEFNQSSEELQETDPLLVDEPDELDFTTLEKCDDLHPLVEELVEEEVHNHHTTWSVVRTHYREALAEGLSVYVQLTLGFGADLAVTLANAGNPNTTAWAWGFATMLAIYISGGVSGAHLNPAITLVLWFYRGFPTRKIPGYFAAQFFGAVFAAMTAYALYYPSIELYLDTSSEVGILNSFVTGPRAPWIGPPTAFFTEFVGTAFLTIAVLALGDDQNAPPGAGMNALILGLVITLLSITFADQTGAAFNPSRDLGPRILLLGLGYGAELFTDPYWLYGPWLGALTGAATGAFLYDLLVFTGGESPVNYPIERAQRALRKTAVPGRKDRGRRASAPEHVP